MSDDAPTSGGEAAAPPAADGGDRPADKDKPAEKSDGSGSEAAEKSDRFAPGGGPTKLKGGAGEAYRRAEQAFDIGRHGAVLAGSSVGTVYVGDHTYQLGRGASRLTPGPVPEKDLEVVRGCYAEIDGYAGLLQRLRDRHLLLLRGVVGTGRTTTALHLLDVVSGAKVARLDAGEGIELIGENDVSAGNGHVVELDGPATNGLSQMHLDRLSALLARCRAWLILVVPQGAGVHSAFAGYVGNCGQPTLTDLLDRHLAWLLRDVDVSIPMTARRLADSPEVREALGPASSPAEIARAAELLAAYGRGEMSEAEVVAGISGGLHGVVADWLEPDPVARRGEAADEANRLVAYRVALAVFHQSPPALVSNAAERLGHQLIRRRHPRREPGVPVFEAEHERWLAASRGHLTEGSWTYGDVRLPVMLSEYRDARMPLAVLSRLWHVHHNAREPVAAWLFELADDSRPEVWLRAAKAVGVLCSFDFDYCLHHLISVWAADTDLNRRYNAAFALDQAARDKAIEPAVRAVVDEWKDGDEVALRWTAAAALGREFGLRRTSAALDDLLALGVWENDGDVPLVYVAAHSLAWLIAQGRAREVADRLTGWLESPRQPVVDLALHAVLEAARLKVAGVLNIELLTAGRTSQLHERRRWPIMLALLADDPDLREPFVGLLWTALAMGRSRKATLEVLDNWITSVQKLPDALPELAVVLRLLGDNALSRARLLHLVADTMMNRPTRPIRPEVAAYLSQAIADPSDDHYAAAGQMTGERR